jgi:hypothetical protein
VRLGTPAGLVLVVLVVLWLTGSMGAGPMMR